MMRLAVSNLAWPAEREDEAFRTLAAMGVSAVEAAPTRLAPWEDLTRPRLADYRARIEGAGLTVSSLQAILFGRAELQLLQSQPEFDAFLEHLRIVAHVASTLGALVLVFGSPRNRSAGDLPRGAAWDLAQQRFRAIGAVVQDGGAVLGIEPVPAYYGGEFLADWRDVLRMVRDVDHPGIRVHLDTGCVHLGGGSIAEAVTESLPYLAHFHAAQPDLADFATPLDNHAEAARALKATGYDRFVSIEMREQPGDPMHAVVAAVQTVRRVYGV